MINLEEIFKDCILHRCEEKEVIDLDSLKKEFEEKDSYSAVYNVAGVKKEDINITIKQVDTKKFILEIKGESFHSESNYSFDVNEMVVIEDLSLDIKRATAKYKDGILVLNFPVKKVEMPTVKIEIA